MDLGKAIKISVNAHDGQKTWNGEPYVLHPIEIMRRIDIKYGGMLPCWYWKHLKIIAVLHDVVEDTDITFADLLNQGIPFYLVTVIELLTRREDESYLDNIKRIKEDNMAIRVKLADMAHNSSTSPKRHQKEKYELAKYILEKT